MPKRTRPSKKSKTGYFGTTQHPKTKKFVAWITLKDGKCKYLGYCHNTVEEAAMAYDREAIQLLRPINKLNFPDQRPNGYTPTSKKLQTNNKYGFRGVSKNSRGNNFRAMLQVQGKYKHLGCSFKTPVEAAVAYDRAVLAYKKCPSMLNFPGMKHNLEVEATEYIDEAMWIDLKNKAKQALLIQSKMKKTPIAFDQPHYTPDN